MASSPSRVYVCEVCGLTLVKPLATSDNGEPEKVTIPCPYRRSAGDNPGLNNPCTPMQEKQNCGKCR